MIRFLVIFVAVITLAPISEGEAKSKSSARKHAVRAKGKKAKSKRVKKRAHAKTRPVPAPPRKRLAPQATVPENPYSGSPPSVTSTAPIRTVIPLRNSAAPREKRVRLDMTKPYGRHSPSPTPGAERGLASTPVNPDETAAEVPEKSR